MKQRRTDNAEAYERGRRDERHELGREAGQRSLTIWRLTDENARLTKELAFANDRIQRLIHTSTDSAFGYHPTPFEPYDMPTYPFDDWGYDDMNGWHNPEDDPATPTETALLDEIRRLRGER